MNFLFKPNFELLKFRLYAQFCGTVEANASTPLVLIVASKSIFALGR